MLMQQPTENRKQTNTVQIEATVSSVERAEANIKFISILFCDDEWFLLYD